MFRRYFNSLLNAMGILLLTILFLSVISPRNVDIWVLQYGACIGIPVHLFSYLTFELKLFSRILWVRRTIVMIFGALTMATMSWVFGFFQLGLKKYVVVLTVGIGISVILSVFSYYVADKKEKKYLEEINKKLSENADK